MPRAFPSELWVKRFRRFLSAGAQGDAAHDLEHLRRVAANALALARAEGARPEIVLAAAWLHDCVIVPKNSPRRAQASALSARRAGLFLRRAGFPSALIPAVEHAIEERLVTPGQLPPPDTER